MTRTAKIVKLANAVREYRGLYDSVSKKWKRPPVKSALKRIVRWMEELGLEPVNEMKAIDNFKTTDDLNEWIKLLPGAN